MPDQMSFLDFLAIFAGYAIGAFIVHGAAALLRRLVQARITRRSHNQEAAQDL